MLSSAALQRRLLPRRCVVEQARVNAVSSSTTSSSTCRKVKRRFALPSSAPGQQPRLAQHLEAVADPQHEPAGVRELDDGLHHRREARDRARAQVVAVGEAAGHDDRVGPAQVALAVPQQLRVADAPRGRQRVDLVAGAGELKDAELHRR